jgi:hypothetical protein
MVEVPKQAVAAAEKLGEKAEELVSSKVHSGTDVKTGKQLWPIEPVVERRPAFLEKSLQRKTPGRSTHGQGQDR